MPREQGPDRPDDRNRLTHMLWAAQEALEFAKGKSRADLDRDRLLLRGLVNCIQEIGEAASKVTDKTASASRMSRGRGSSGCGTESFTCTTTSTNRRSGVWCRGTLSR